MNFWEKLSEYILRETNLQLMTNVSMQKKLGNVQTLHDAQFGVF